MSEKTIERAALDAAEAEAHLRESEELLVRAREHAREARTKFANAVTLAKDELRSGSLSRAQLAASSAGEDFLQAQMRADEAANLAEILGSDAARETASEAQAVADAARTAAEAAEQKFQDCRQRFSQAQELQSSLNPLWWRASNIASSLGL